MINWGGPLILRMMLERIEGTLRDELIPRAHLNAESNLQWVLEDSIPSPEGMIRWSGEWSLGNDWENMK